MNKIIVISISILVCVSVTLSGTLVYPRDMPMAVFASEHIQTALDQNKLSDWNVSLTVDTELSEQAYRITRDGKTVTVAGGDARGVMYGGLELAERIRLGQVKDLDKLKGKPFLKQRGIKFNIPLDARTPSFHDAGHAAQNNTPEMWNGTFGLNSWITWLYTGTTH